MASASAADAVTVFDMTTSVWERRPQHASRAEGWRPDFDERAEPASERGLLETGTSVRSVTPLGPRGMSPRDMSPRDQGHLTCESLQVHTCRSGARPGRDLDVERR